MTNNTQNMVNENLKKALVEVAKNFDSIKAGDVDSAVTLFVEKVELHAPELTVENPINLIHQVFVTGLNSNIVAMVENNDPEGIEFVDLENEVKMIHTYDGEVTIIQVFPKTKYGLIAAVGYVIQLIDIIENEEDVIEH